MQQVTLANAAWLVSDDGSCEFLCLCPSENYATLSTETE